MSQDTILLSEQPISNRYIPRDAAIRPPIYHLGIKIDYELNLIRLDPHIPCEELRPRVPWINAFEPEKHLDKMVSEILNLPGISKDSVFGAYSFKDDSTLQRINNLGYLNSWRIDPKIDLGVSKKNAGIETFQAHLDNTSLLNLKKRHYAPDVFIARHVIEHSFDIMNFINFVRKVIKPGGYIVFELPDCTKSLLSGDLTMIWEEHLYYFTKDLFKNFLLSCGFEIIKLYEEEYSNENCIIAIIRDLNGGRQELWELKDPNIFFDIFIDYGKKYYERKKILMRKFQEIEAKGLRVAIYGAGHYSVAFTSTLGIGSKILFAIDDDLNKLKYYMPSDACVPIFSSSKLNKKNIDICLLGLNSVHQQHIIKKHEQFTKDGGIFASIFPGDSTDIATL